MDEQTEQGPSHIDLTGSWFPITGILVVAGGRPNIVGLANTRKT